MKKLTLTVGLVVFSTTTAWCVPRALNFQGRLSESGVPVNGNRAMAFKIYDAASGGNLLFSESRSVTVSTGVFNVLVGEATTGGIPLSIFDGSDRHIEVQVGAQVLPRQRIVSVGYAFYAEQARSLVDGLTIQFTSITANNISVSTIVATTILGNNAAFTGELTVGDGTIHLQGQVGGQLANAITITQLAGQNPPQIRTSAGGAANTSALAATGATPLIINAGATGNLFLNPFTSGNILLAKSTVTSTGALILAPDASLSMSGPLGTITTGSSVTASAFFGTMVDAESARFGAGATKSIFTAPGSLILAPNAGLTLSGPTGDITTDSSVTASAFFGDGSGLTGITATDNTKVAKAGDTMTGQLTLAGSTLTVTGNAFSVGGSTLVVNSGNVGIGTTAPGAKLDVGGGVKMANDAATCNASKAGTMRWTGVCFEGCDGELWRTIMCHVITQSNPGRTCKTILDAGFSTGSGIYWIAPDGNTSNAFQAYCDMVNQGGGWTLVVGIEATNGNHLNPAAVTPGNLTSPTGKGKYSNATINLIKLGASPAYRLTCGLNTGYFQTTCVFDTTAFTLTACMEASYTYPPPSYSPTLFIKQGSRALDNDLGNVSNRVSYGSVAAPVGCSGDITWNQSGTLYVR